MRERDGRSVGWMDPRNGHVSASASSVSSCLLTQYSRHGRHDVRMLIFECLGFGIPNSSLSPNEQEQNEQEQNEQEQRRTKIITRAPTDRLDQFCCLLSASFGIRSTE